LSSLPGRIKKRDTRRYAAGSIPFLIERVKRNSAPAMSFAVPLPHLVAEGHPRGVILPQYAADSYVSCNRFLQRAQHLR
jgi:hypothetical protein